MTVVALSVGRRGPDVERWQRFLNDRNLRGGAPDGIFGSETDAATREFQRQNQLTVDGIVGQKTLLRAQELGFIACRRLRDDEVTDELRVEAIRIRDAHWQAPFGSEFPFAIDGTHYFGRIEQHYHPPGGPLKPWGYHHGVSLFIEAPISSDAVVHSPS
jgi:hypothetical protein